MSSDTPTHGQVRGYSIQSGSMGGPGLHSECEKYCENCKQWCFSAGIAGELNWRWLHDSKECVRPFDNTDVPKWWKKKQ